MNLIYKTYVGDEDSLLYETVSKAMRWGPLVYIGMEKYMAHITKRMGTGIREMVHSCEAMKLKFKEFSNI